MGQEHYGNMVKDSDHLRQFINDVLFLGSNPNWTFSDIVNFIAISTLGIAALYFLALVIRI